MSVDPVRSEAVHADFTAMFRAMAVIGCQDEASYICSAELVAFEKGLFFAFGKSNAVGVSHCHLHYRTIDGVTDRKYL